MTDLRFAFRQLAKAPGFAVVAILTLAIGIGACTAIFSVVDGVLLRPLPYRGAERLVYVQESMPPNLADALVSPGNFSDWQQQSKSFSALVAEADTELTLSDGGDPVHVNAVAVTPNYVSGIGAAPAMGRDFVASDADPGRGDAVILSHRYWIQQFGGRTDVINHKVRINGGSVTIIGVLPANFEPVGWPDLLIPLIMRPQDRQLRTSHYLRVVGQLRPGVTVSQAALEMDLLASRLGDQYPQTNRGWKVKLTPLWNFKVGPVRPQLLILLGAVGLLLIISCSNIANLVMVRTTARAKEIAVRTAMGAGRGRIIRQLVTEHVILSLLGGTLGVFAANWGLNLLMALAPADFPRRNDIAIDLRVLAFSFLLTLITGVVFGLIPAFGATRMDLNSVFKDGGRGAGGGLLKRKLLNALVIAELAIALTLLCGAGLLIRSYQRLREVDPGFEPRSALTFQVLLNYRRLITPAQVDLFVQEVDREITALPGITHAGFTLSLPILNDMISRYFIEGQAPLHESDFPASDCYVVTPDYLAAMGITLLQGRGFTDHDTANAMQVALINQTLAKQHFGSGNPIGRRIKVSPPWLPATWRTIVGVVADVRQYGLDIKPMPQVYLAFRQTPSYSGSFVVRTAGASAGLLSAIRSLIFKLDRDQPIADIHPMEDWIVFSTATRRFALQLITVFSIVALSLAAIGIYGVVSYSVSQRTGEIGIRIALGAQPGDVVGMVVRQGIAVTIVGLGLGLCGALVLARLIASLLYGLSAEDPLTLVAATSITAFIALSACLVPAMRAARVDPLVALRTE